MEEDTSDSVNLAKNECQCICSKLREMNDQVATREERALRYFGHVTRKDGKNLEQTIIFGKVPGTKEGGMVLEGLLLFP